MEFQTISAPGFKSLGEPEGMVNLQLLLAFTLYQTLIMLVLGLRTTCTILISVIGFLESTFQLGSLCGLILLENVGDVYY